MDRLVYSLAIFFVLSFTAAHGYHFRVGDGDPLGLNVQRDVLQKRDKPAGGIWFGPRLGRRERRSVEDVDELYGTGGILEVIREAPWALVPLAGNGRQNVNYTPRLGRDSNEEEEAEIALMDASPPFSPRLGRRLVPFSPRLGRQQSQNDVYSPRLGRSAPLSSSSSSSAAEQKQQQQ